MGNSIFRYRPHLDGIRALAIFGVLIFHFFPSLLPGGFMGVDSFFVLSGYLITSVSLADRHAGTFSVKDFFRRRILRIFPALLVVLGVVVVVGYVTFFAEELRALGAHVFGGATFLSNIFSMFESGYFDLGAESKPLLHLWSLGVEEQFYLLFPFLFLAATRLRNEKSVVLSLGSLLLCSFVFNVIEVHRSSSVAFYFPLSRFWEPLVGCLLAFVVFVSKREKVPLQALIALTSLAILIASFLIPVPANEFPGYWALLPVCATAGLILFGDKSNLVGKFLDNSFARYIGKISFSLYLWHWVLLSFIHIFSNGIPSQESKVFSLFFTFALSALTYEFVERRTRRLKKAVPLLVSLTIVMALIGGALYLGNGLPGRPVAQNSVSLFNGMVGGFQGVEKKCEGNDSEKSQKIFTCLEDSRGIASSAIIGDSKAGAIAPALFRLSTAHNRWIYYGSGPAGSLLPMITDSQIYFSKSWFKPETGLIPLQEIIRNSNIKNVVISSATRVLFQLNSDSEINDLQNSQNFQVAFDGLTKYVKVLTDNGKRVFLLVDNPTLPHPEFCLSRITGLGMLDDFFTKPSSLCSISFDDFNQKRRLYLQLLEKVVETNPSKISIIDATRVYCHNFTVCNNIIDKRFPMYGFTDHVSDYAASYVARIILDSVE